jgi:NADPH:quinone reductase-like Zn-dependent oxidoreductase
VTAHIPTSSPLDRSSSSRAHKHHNDDDDEGDDDDDEDDAGESQSQESRSGSSSTEVATPSLEERARLFGASHVMRGEPLVVIAEAGAGVFDYVLDTVGGRRIWDASRWILKPGGQFTTLVGDKGAEHPAYEGNSLKSSMRSIRSAMRRSTPLSSPTSGKGIGRRHGKQNGEGVNENVKANGKSKGCGYEWVMPNAALDTEGEDVRDTLAAVATLAEQGVMVPWPKQAMPFEQTPEAFVESRGLLENGGVVVSKLIG